MAPTATVAAVGLSGALASQASWARRIGPEAKGKKRGRLPIPSRSGLVPVSSCPCQALWESLLSAELQHLPVRLSALRAADRAGHMPDWRARYREHAMARPEHNPRPALCGAHS